MVYKGNNIQFLLGQPIVMPYIYYLLLPHKLNLSWVVRGLPSNSKQALRETAARGGEVSCTSEFVDSYSCHK